MHLLLVVELSISHLIGIVIPKPSSEFKKHVKNWRGYLVNLAEARSIKWDEQYKGLDDFLFGAGQVAFDLPIELERLCIKDFGKKKMPSRICRLM